MTFELFSLQNSEEYLNEEREECRNTWREESTDHWGTEETQPAEINRKRMANTLDRAVPNDLVTGLSRH